ncbi:MAG: hypothetical protein AB8B80_03590 [Marinicellaceae bacterium]
MKTIIKVIIGLVALIALAVMAAFYFTADLPKTAEKFFTAVKNDNMTLAYSYVSNDFKKATSEQSLKSFLQKNGLDQYKSATWKNRQRENSSGQLVGYVLTETDVKVPISINLIKFEDDWKIHRIDKAPSGVTSQTKTPQMPSEQDLIRLTNETLWLFVKSVSQNNMELIRNQSSSLFQKQVSLEAFNDAYQSFFKFEDKLLIIENLSPQFTSKAQINKDGVLIVKGQYPLKPNPLVFTSKYLYEGYGWKLLGLNVEIGKSE